VQLQLKLAAAGLLPGFRVLLWAIVVALAGLMAPVATAAERVQVTDPYIELRTGPGRGYPVFYVAERHDWIEIELRHTDWFRVRTEKGKVGWVFREQLASTLTEAGERKTFRDVVLDDYLHRRVEMGAAYGHFKSDPMLKAWLSYNMTDNVAVELTAGQVQGIFSGTDFWHLNLLMEPWSEWRLAPFLGIGVGRLMNVPNQSLVGAKTSNANMADAMVGLRFHISERFVARVDYTMYTSFISDSKTDQYRAITAGLSFFF
jgi:hypothetical protein